jgi:hypothetical protein
MSSEQIYISFQSCKAFFETHCILRSTFKKAYTPLEYALAYCHHSCFAENRSVDSVIKTEVSKCVSSLRNSNGNRCLLTARARSLVACIMRNIRRMSPPPATVNRNKLFVTTVMHVACE